MVGFHWAGPVWRNRVCLGGRATDFPSAGRMVFWEQHRALLWLGHGQHRLVTLGKSFHSLRYHFLSWKRA